MLGLLGWKSLDTIGEFAGQESVATLGLWLVGEVKVPALAVWILALMFYGLWRRERSLRHQSIARLSQRPAELERIIDQSRSGSELIESGEANPQEVP